MANHTIIVGVALSGLCLAHALIARGGSVTVFERHQGPGIRGRGYRLTIDDMGSAALRDCLPSRNYDFMRATAGIAGEQGAFVFLNEHARELSRFTFDLAATDRRGSITGQVDRATLRLALLSRLREHVRFGRLSPVSGPTVRRPPLRRSARTSPACVGTVGQSSGMRCA
jgi:2-polyprenyl-6-methoxyphenol hydroxylase-like FAD-dependent oxidoreductase